MTRAASLRVNENVVPRLLPSRQVRWDWAACVIFAGVAICAGGAGGAPTAIVTVAGALAFVPSVASNVKLSVPV